ncbi:flavodoxin [Clostridium sp.]|uniref:flavodoxin n=1 Tax=Clostridium sp. TaxID=1506 RepID=UPI002A916D40|nr:flavodoxin [Clostridium sp.]MDY6011733.1 flavodoxin [Clostridium sp.]
MKVVYWSQTGNTEKMANLIAQGIKEAGKEAEVVSLSDITVDDLKNEEIIIFGNPAYGAEQLEESEVEPFVDSLEGNIEGKKVALFGSWGWGEGEWMKELEEKIESYGATLIAEGLTVKELPEGEDETRCIEFGKLIAKEA